MTGSTFLNLFVKSPFKRLEAHMSVVQKCVGVLDDLFDACQNEDWDGAKNHYAYIASKSRLMNMKHKTIKIHHDLYRRLTLRIIDFIDMQDQLANKAEDIVIDGS